MNVIKSIKLLLKNLELAKMQSGKRKREQILEILELRKRILNLGISDYFNYRLYMDDEYQEHPKHEVAGWRMLHFLDNHLNPLRWRPLASDKVVAHIILKSFELPTPKIYAIYAQNGRKVAGAQTLHSDDAVYKYLREEASYPLFLKPIYGGVGSGAIGIVRFISKEDSVELSNGSTLTMREFFNHISVKRKYVLHDQGYMFQEFLTQHDTISKICGPHISSLRLVVLMTELGPKVFRGIWRIIAKNNMTDNFDEGDSGNLIAAVNLGDGSIDRVVQGFGLKQKILSSHPDTGESFCNFKLPRWDKVIEICHIAAKCFPMIKFQHWDFAFTPQGPVIMEVNSTGSIDMIQYATGRGLYDETLQAFVGKYGIKDEKGNLKNLIRYVPG